MLRMSVIRYIGGIQPLETAFLFLHELFLYSYLFVFVEFYLVMHTMLLKHLNKT